MARTMAYYHVLTKASTCERPAALTHTVQLTNCSTRVALLHLGAVYDADVTPSNGSARRG